MDEALLGWTGALLLVGTIIAQVCHQWRVGSSHGVSPWLFTGQATASIGLLVFSALRNEMVFVVLNTAMALAAGAGLWLCMHHRRCARRPSA